MSYNRKNTIIKTIIFQVTTAIIIALISLFLIYYVQGYRVDWKNMSLIQTGVMVLFTDPAPDRIVINGEEQEVDNELALSLTPGHYDVEISKEGFSTWQRSLNVGSEIVASEKDIILFRTNPETTTLLEQKNIDLINAPDTTLVEFAPQELHSNGHEIWVNSNLVTRFSKDATNVKWYPDMAHIMYQMDDEIRIIEATGYNDTLLVKLSSDSLSRFAIGGKGKELYFTDNDLYFKAIIK